MAFTRDGFCYVVLLFTVCCNGFRVERLCTYPGATGPLCVPKQNKQQNAETSDEPFQLNNHTQNNSNTNSDKADNFIQINLSDAAMSKFRKIILIVGDDNDNANPQTVENDPYVSKVELNSRPEDAKSKPSVAAQPTFRSDYKLYPDYGFYKYHAPATWPEARRICNTENAHLPIVDTEAKARMLIDMYHAQPRPAHLKHPDQIHIGMHDLFKEGHFVTLFDEPLENMEFKHWAPGNPSNSNGKEHCGTLRETIDLNDFPCADLELGFICEKRIKEIH